MDSQRQAAAGFRIHHELLRAHIETGFSLVHLAETSSPISEALEMRRALSEAHVAISESKRLLSLIDPATVDDFRSELALLEFELHDLELHSAEHDA